MKKSKMKWKWKMLDEAYLIRFGGVKIKVKISWMKYNRVESKNEVEVKLRYYIILCNIDRVNIEWE